MKAAPPSCRLTTNRMRSALGMKAVEHGEVAFARHAERGVDTLRDQTLDDQMARGLCIHGK
jgi:hypothetical protein